MATVSFSPSPGSMGGGLSRPDLFPGEHFGINIPEAIGDAARTVWQNLIRTEWELLNTYGQITVLRSTTTTKYKYQYNNVSIQVIPDDGMTQEIHFWVIVKE